MNDTLKQLVKTRRHQHESIATLETGDPIAELFQVLQMQSVFYTQARLSAPWGIEIPAIKHSLMFHFVVAGKCIVDVDGELTAITTGDFLLVPHGKGHKLMSSSETPCQALFDLPIETVSGFYERLEFGGGGEVIQLLCGAVSFDHPIAAKLLDMMPVSLLIQGDRSEASATMDAMIRLLATESTQPALGTEAVITRLADLLVIQALRVWLGSGIDAHRGWLSALQEPGLGNALRAVHRQPGAPWSLDKLAVEAGMSRTRFAETFKQKIGQSAMEYVSQWRMSLARSRLQKTTDPIIHIALDLGYQSEAAFGRAYKKTMGRTPGQDRKSLA